MSEAYFSEEQAVEYLGIDVETFRGLFPPPANFKLGAFKKYRRSDIDAYVGSIMSEQRGGKLRDADLLTRKVLVHFAKLEFTECIPLLREAISLNSADADNHFRLGISYFRTDNFVDAEMELRRALETSSKAEWADAALNYMEQAQNKMVEAAGGTPAPATEEHGH